MTRPLGKARKRAVEAYPYEFLPVEGEDLHQIPVGPVHAGIIEPGHSALPPTARRWCGSNSGSAMCTRAPMG